MNLEQEQEAQKYTQYIGMELHNRYGYVGEIVDVDVYSGMIYFVTSGNKGRYWNVNRLDGNDFSVKSKSFSADEYLAQLSELCKKYRLEFTEYKDNKFKVLVLETVTCRFLGEFFGDTIQLAINKAFEFCFISKDG